MSQRGVEIVLGRLATDGAVRERFMDSPGRVLQELIAEGIELTRIEITALQALDKSALRRFAAAVDARLQRATLLKGD